MWNVEKNLLWRTYFQGRNTDADVESGHVDLRVEGQVGQIGR